MTETTVKIFPDVMPKDLRQLAVNVCLKAIEQTRDRDPLTALDACLWLLSSDFGLWAEVAGIPYADTLQLLTSGRRVKTKRGSYAKQ